MHLLDGIVARLERINEEVAALGCLNVKQQGLHIEEPGIDVLQLLLLQLFALEGQERALFLVRFQQLPDDFDLACYLRIGSGTLRGQLLALGLCTR